MQKAARDMRIKEEYRLQELGDDHLLIGPAAGPGRRIVRLNESAAFLWRSVAARPAAEGRDFSVAVLADLLQARYGLDPATATRDARSIAAAWQESGVVEER